MGDTYAFTSKGGRPTKLASLRETAWSRDSLGLFGSEIKMRRARASCLAEGWSSSRAGLSSSSNSSLKRLTSRKSSRQSNLIARWPRRVIHQTMASKARVRPTSGQTRSNAANTTPDPCFIAPLRGCFYFRRWSGQRAALVPTRSIPTHRTAVVLGHIFCTSAGGRNF
jgi:hypothetical protein